MRADPPTDAETYRRPLTARQSQVLRTLIDWTLADGFQVYVFLYPDTRDGQVAAKLSQKVRQS